MLDLFEKVEVKKINRLNTEDLIELEERQSNFNNAKKVYYQLEKIVNSIENENVTEYLSHISLKDEIRERLQKATQSFITGVYWHFTSKYKIELSSKLWSEDVFRWKYTNRGHTWEEAIKYVESMNYEKIIDDIYSQTGTLNFQDKGKQEFLENFRKKIGYKIKHKSNSIYFNSLVRRDSWDNYSTSYSCDCNLQLLFQGINLFENENYTLSSWANDFITNCRSPKYGFVTFSVHSNIPFSEIIHIKIYRNGKVELKFESYELAERFYNMFHREG